MAKWQQTASSELRSAIDYGKRQAASAITYFPQLATPFSKWKSVRCMESESVPNQREKKEREREGGREAGEMPVLSGMPLR